MSDAVELHDVDVKEFLAVIDTCEGDVFLVTDEGDRLNLKSKLCQLIGLTQLIDGGKITNAHLECHNPEDESNLHAFRKCRQGESDFISKKRNIRGPVQQRTGPDRGR